MNVELLRKIKDHILEEPKRLAMGEWIQRSEDTSFVQDSYSESCPTQPFAPCGTAGCIAGWAVLLNEPNFHGYAVLQKARTLLGFEPDEGSLLFYVDYWPEEFQTAYKNAKTPEEKARITADRIEHFITTGGTEMKYTNDQIRGWAMYAGRYGGSFCSNFGGAIMHADDHNFKLLRPVAYKLIDKYPNYLSQWYEAEKEMVR